MSKRNAELARVGYDALNHAYSTGDFAPLERHLELAFHPDCVIEAEAEIFTEGEWHGHDGFLGFVANQMEVLEDMWLEPEEFIAEQEFVVVPLIFGGRARHSEIPVKMPVVHVYDMRGGKAWRMRFFRSRAEAL